MNDPLLAPLFDSEDEATRRAAIERILADAGPLIDRVLSRSRTSSMRAEDLADIRATVMLRLVRRLQSVSSSTDDSIASFSDFAATVTYHSVYDFLRSRFPERTRLKTRIRYVVVHDARFALWSTDAGLICGLRAAQGSASLGTPKIQRDTATAAMLDRSVLGNALEAIFKETGAIALDDLVDLGADLWAVTEAQSVDLAEAVDVPVSPIGRLENYEYLAALWKEIRKLRLAQRIALLLNLRDPEGLNAVALLTVVGIATLEEIAGALELSIDQLSVMWNDLPLDDLRIGEILGLRRQQVINLRKSARERLARRMLAREGGRRP